MRPLLFRVLRIPVIASLAVIIVIPSIASAQSQTWPPAWNRVSGPFLSGVAHFRAMYFSDPLNGVVAAEDIVPNALGNPKFGIYYRHNGSRWLHATIPNYVTTVRAIRPINGELYAADSGSDVLVSTDSGVTWKYAGLGLPNTYDVYADPFGGIHALTGNMRVFARVDNLHCVAAGIGNEALISNDGGVTWTSITIGTDTLSYFVYGDSCQHTFIYHGDQGTVYRSTDFGVTWIQALVGCGGYSESIHGADEVVYIGTEDGLFRSLDDGSSYWEEVNNSYFNGNTGYPQLMDTSLLDVFGPMGQYVATYAMSPDSSPSSVWMTSDGGDYTLRTPIALADTLGNLVDTLQIPQLCPGLRIPVPFLSGIDSITTVISIVQDSLSEFTITGPSTFTFSAGVPNNAWLNYIPRQLPDVSTLTLKFEHSWHCSRWEEFRTIIVTTPSLVQIISPNVISANCSIVSSSDSITYGAACQSLVLTSVSSSLSSLSCTTVLPDTVSGGSSLAFQFDPNNPATANGTDTIEVKGHYLGISTAFDTIFTVNLVASATAPQLVSIQKLLSFGSLNLCGSARDTFAVFANQGCVVDTITSITLRGTGFSTTTNSFPIILAPGTSDTLHFVFTPLDTITGHDTNTFLGPDTGTYTGSANVFVEANGDTQYVSLDLIGSTFQDVGLPTISNKNIVCGIISSCVGDTIIADTLTNPGCDTIVVSEIAFYGDSTLQNPDSAFLLLAPASDTLIIPPHSSGILRFSYTPKTSNIDSIILSITSSIIHNDVSNVYPISVSGSGLGETRVLSANIQKADLGQLYACQSRDTTIKLYNTGCNVLTVIHDSLVNGAFVSDTTFPLTIQPNDSASVRITLLANQVTTYDTLRFFSDANVGDSIITVPLQASILAPEQLHLSLSAPDSGKDGAMVTFYLILASAGSIGAVDSLQFQLAHNDDLLSFVNKSGISIQRGTPLHGMEIDTLGWRGTSSLPDTIGSLTFGVYLTDSATTPLTLSNISFSNSRGLPNDCIASINDSNSGFTYLYYHCGEPIIQNAMLGVPITITSIVPNPAQNEITVQLSGDTRTTIEMYDGLGRGRDVRSTSLRSGIMLDVSGVPSGIYFIRVSAGGYVQSRSVVIKH